MPSRLTLIALGSSLSILACDKTKPVAREAESHRAEAPAELEELEPEPAPRTLAEAQPPPALPSKAPSGPGPAYFAVGGIESALVMLDDRGFRQLGSERMSISRLILARDGALWAGGTSGVFRVAGETLEAIDMEGAPRGFMDMGVDRSGRIWVLGFDALGRHDEQGWVKLDYADIDLSIEHERAIVGDAEGRILLSTMDGLFMWDGETWARESMEGVFEGAEIYGKLVTRFDHSRVILATSGGTLERGPEGWKRVEVGLRIPSKEQLRVSLDGRLVQASIEGEVSIETEAEPRILRLAELGLGGQEVHGLYLDAGDRLWLGTDNGLEILDAQLALTSYPPATVPALSGKVEDIVVLGSGPTRLPAAGPMQTGTVTGRLLVAGEPLGHSPIELCPSPDLMYRGETPCAGKALHFSGRSDEEGRFRIEGVARADLNFTFRVGEAWKLTLIGASCCEQLEPGGTLDLGDLSFDAD